MFSKIFLSILLLTCVYTNILKSIKDNNDTNFAKLPDKLNFEQKEIEAVKPNLKDQMHIVNKVILTGFLKIVFGLPFVRKIEEYKIISFKKVGAKKL